MKKFRTLEIWQYFFAAAASLCLTTFIPQIELKTLFSWLIPLLCHLSACAAPSPHRALLDAPKNMNFRVE